MHYTLYGNGFDNATGCVVNGNLAAVNSLFPSLYKGYNSPILGGFLIDVLGTCNSTYGTAWSGSRFIGIANGEAITIDLGSILVPGNTFTMPSITLVVVFEIVITKS